MRNRILSAAAVFLVLSLVVSCGGAASNNCGTSTTNVTVQFVWVANESAQSISGYELSSAGELTSTGSDTLTGGNGPHEIAFDPASKLLFVLNHNTANVSVFKVDAQTGTLTAVTGSPATVGVQVTSMALHPSGKFLFVTDTIGGLYAYSVDTATGALTPLTGSPFATGTQPGFIVVHPNGKFLYVAGLAAPMTLNGYTIDTTNATITAMEAPFDLGTYTPAAMLTDAEGKYLFVATAEGTLSYFDIDATTGELTENAHSPISVTSSAGVELVINGSFIYALDTTMHVINLYQMQQDGSMLTLANQPVGSAQSPKGISLDANGKYVIVTDSTGAKIATYSINSSTGELTAVASGTAGVGAGHIARGNIIKQVTTPVACDGSSGGSNWH